MTTAKASIYYKKNSFKLCLLILGLVIGTLVYIPGLPGNFIHDDFPNIVTNKHLNIEQLDLDSLYTASFSSKAGPLRRPISMFSFALTRYYAELNPLPYKIFNILIHLLVGLCLFFLTRLLIDSFERLTNKTISSERCFYVSLFIAMAWLLSPINLTGVLYIVQRMTSLAALFSVLGLIFYVIGRRLMIFERRFNIYYFLLSGLSFIAAIFCKETGSLNLFYLILIEICFLNFTSNAFLSSKSFRITFLIITVSPIAFATIWLIYNPSYALNGYDFRAFSIEERLLTQARGLLYYLKWILVPNITELGLFHDDIPISKSIFEPISTLISIVALVLLFILSISIIKKLPFLSFGILFFFSSHLLESSLFPLELIYEHRNYLASYGIIFAVTTTLYFFLNIESSKKIAIFIGCLWLCAIGYSTTIRAYQWKDSLSFAYYESSHHPESARATFDLGRTYVNLAMADALEEKDKAIAIFENSMQLMPHEIAAESAAIIFSSLIKSEIKQEWIDSILDKLKNNPATHVTIECLKEFNRCLANTCSMTKQQVFDIYQVALSNKLPTANKYRSDVLTLYGEFAANQLNDFNIAYHAMKDAIEITPYELQYRINFSLLLIAMRKYDEAESQIRFVEKNDNYNLHRDKLLLIKQDLQHNRQNRPS